MEVNAAIEGPLAEIVDRIKKVAQPRQVILFGSAARGEMGENSDFDLLVVVSAGTHRRRMAQAIYQSLVGVGFAADIIVVTDEDLKNYRNNPGMVIKPALDEGKLLYAA